MKKQDEETGMNTKIEFSYIRAEAVYQKDHIAAKALYEQIIVEIGDKKFDEMCDMELRIFALSKLKVFLCSQLHDRDSAMIAIDAFETFLQRNKNDIVVYEYYIVALQLTWQYEKSHKILIDLFGNTEMKMFALKWLSSFTYAIDSCQTSSDCILYKKQLIELTDAPEEKKRLQKELDEMQNH